MNLLEHQFETPDTALRGTAPSPFFDVHGSPSGPLYWVDIGEWVYELQKMPVWDLNQIFEGRILKPDGSYGNSLLPGELEGSTLRQVPPNFIKRYGKVGEGASGRRFVVEWFDNPNFNPKTKQYTFTIAP